MINPPPVQHHHSNRASHAAPLRRSALVVPDSGSRRFDGASSHVGASSSRERILGPPTRLGVGLGQPKGGDPGHLLVSAWHSSDFFRAWQGKVDAARAPPGRSGQGRPRSEPSGDDSSRAANNNTSDASLPKISFSPACRRTDRRAAFTTLQTRVRRAGTARRGPRRPARLFLFCRRAPYCAAERRHASSWSGSREASL